VPKLSEKEEKNTTEKDKINTAPYRRRLGLADRFMHIELKHETSYVPKKGKRDFGSKKSDWGIKNAS